MSMKYDKVLKSYFRVTLYESKNNGQNLGNV